MEAHIIREFNGVISGVKFNRSETFESTFILLREIESKFNISIDDKDKEFIEDIMHFTALANFTEHFSRNDLLNATTNNIQAADKLEDVLFVSHKLDNGDNFYNRDINKYIADPTKYTSLKNRIKNKIKENSKPTLSVSKPKENGGLER